MQPQFRQMPPQGCPFHQRHLHAKLCGSNRRYISTRSTADNDEILRHVFPFAGRRPALVRQV